MRASLLALVLSGCCTLRPGSVQCEEAKYGTGWTHITVQGAEVPRCTADLLAVMDTLLPDPKLRPLHGVIVWHPEPFLCGLERVWGCAPSVERSYATASVAAAKGVHVSDTAAAEELGHWVWFHYRPEVDPIEGWRTGPDGRPYYWRDPDFQNWFNLVRAETRGLCK